MTSWCPYPFVDVTLHGYGAVLLTAAGIHVLFVVLSAGAYGLDRLLGRGLPSASELLDGGVAEQEPLDPL